MSRRLHAFATGSFCNPDVQPQTMSSAHTPSLPAPLISAAELASRLSGVLLFDARFELSQPLAGAAAYAEGHLPGAAYLDLDRHLSTKDSAAALCGGRHPLPTAPAFAHTLGQLGVTPAQAVVIYDTQGGMFAARAWWMLRWLGHREVAVLDGGLKAWQQAGGALESGVVPAPAPVADYPLPADLAMPTIDAATLQATLGRPVLIDARGAERYRGDVEPLDPVAGHIPGALNRPFTQNLGADGRFLPADALRAGFAPLLSGRPAAEVVHQCGSGVTACHNLLAMDVAGLAGSQLYPGSWSEWCSDPARPVARG
ncbi:Rhodanese domain protein [Leptothrix cholodnii SP-6]|uniref:Rhodanese domain protein n=1 Tax=Leptothrix cholodnii (strain ATCC 51168 / LMG 8142 / SP-6) TaxID=395495 RepID=B1Y2W9_LEPCP|nr:Rhodanese domain protein [Leptothrix cholodnii SP-6]